jgi:hypothetical protein
LQKDEILGAFAPKITSFYTTAIINNNNNNSNNNIYKENKFLLGIKTDECPPCKRIGSKDYKRSNSMSE